MGNATLVGVLRLIAMPATSPQRHLKLVDGAETPLTVAEIYREHVGFVRRSSIHLGIARAVADDVVHDVFLVVHRRLDDYDGRGSLRSWLYGITRRVVMHHRRSGQRRERREHRGPRPAPAPDPEMAVASVQAAEWIEGFIARLDPKQRAVFVLSDIEGLTAPEVAEATGMGLNVVYSRLRLARRRFERAVQRSNTGGGQR